MRRPYIAETAIQPGTGVVQGSAENKVKAPGSGGSGDFIGVYAWEANRAKEAGDEVGIALAGVEKVLAGGDVTAGKKAILKGDTSGAFINIGSAAGRYAACGTFLESGSAGQYVDLIIERGSVTIPGA
ncbi:MAG: hypothetical protein LBF77_02545 [Spirochaetaceae bacterium]|jgi:hypothetical protein|nr:hypothetical protein [Spirochaetaceae bacterium]